MTAMPGEDNASLSSLERNDVDCEDLEPFTVPMSHSTRAGQYQLDRFRDFITQFNSAAKAVFPKTTKRYEGTFVLLLRWEADDLGTESEIEALDQLFREGYHYQTERYLIPSVDPSVQLEDRLIRFRGAYNESSNLLIIYYGGHGRLERNHNRFPSRSIWQAREKDGPSLIWSHLQGVLERAKSDVLFILDCCYAATAVRGASSKEGLWACNSEVPTTDVNDNSFTRNLIEELKVLRGKRFNIAMLHTRLMRRYKRPGSHMLLTEPWYSFLGDAISPSIELFPQSPRHATSSDPGSSQSGTSTSSENFSQNSSQTSLSSDPAVFETWVLLAVRLKHPDQVPELGPWQDWCHEQAPDDVDSVNALGQIRPRDLLTIEANFLSHSTLLLVSVPVFIWDRLSESNAYSFIGYIRSPNRVTPAFREHITKDADVATGSEDVRISQKGQGARTPRVPVTGEGRLAPRFLSSGQSAEADKMKDQATEQGQPRISPEDSERALAESNAIWEFGTEGSLDLAETAWLQVIEARKNILQRDALEIVTSLSNLAWVYRKLALWKGEEEIQTQALKIGEAVLGNDHPQTLTSLSNLAGCLRLQGKYEEAVTLYKKALAKREEQLGPEHPEILVSLGHLAICLEQLSKYEEAAVVRKRVLVAREKQLGREHPETLASVDRLAVCLQQLGKHKEAEALYGRVLAETAKQFGPYHPETLARLGHIFKVLKRQGQDKLVEQLLQMIGWGGKSFEEYE